MDEEEKVEARKRERDRKRRKREEKKCETVPSIAQPVRPQVFAKMIKRTKLSLRGTPDQNVLVLKKLLNESADIEMIPPATSLCKQIPENTIESVKKFYLNDEISRSSPNASDVITVTVNGQKIKIGVKHLLYSIKETHGMFMKEFPEMRIGLTKFSTLKPINVRSFSKMPHNVCVCQIHENLRCALKSLQKADQIYNDVNTDNGMHLNFTCSEPTIDCFFNNCQFCIETRKLKFVENECGARFETISWSKWIKTDQMKKDDKNTNVYCNIEKVKKTGTLIELLKEIDDQVPDFLEHQYVKMNQAKSSRVMIEKASAKDSDSAVIILDFAEKFKCIQQNAPQSAHYGQTPVSIFTVAVYHRGFKPKAIASDCEKHTKEVVLAYLDAVLQELPSTAKRVDIWTDNATSQFKNQFIINSIATFEKRYKIKLVWNFYAPMHGKSVVDGIGGSVKRFVRERIIAQDLQVKSAEDFVEVCLNHATEVILMNSCDIEQRNASIKFSNIIKDSRKITDIKQNHCFETQDNSSKKFSQKIVCHKITP